MTAGARNLLVAVLTLLVVVVLLLLPTSRNHTGTHPRSRGPAAPRGVVGATRH